MPDFAVTVVFFVNDVADADTANAIVSKEIGVTGEDNGNVQAMFIRTVEIDDIGEPI